MKQTIFFFTICLVAGGGMFYLALSLIGCGPQITIKDEGVKCPPQYDYQLNILNDSVMEVYDNGQFKADYEITWKTALDSIILLDNPGPYIIDK